MRLSGNGTSDSGDMKVDNTRKSERLLKQTAPPVPRMSTRLEQQSTPSPARRSARIQTQGSSAEKASSPINSHNKKGLKEKSVEQRTREAAQVSPSDTDNSTKRKILNARSYKALFKKQKNSKGGEGKFEQGNQVDIPDKSVSISQPLEHRENVDILLESGEQVTQLESESCVFPLEVDSSRIELNGRYPDKKIKWLEKQQEKEILDFHKAKEQGKSRLEKDYQIESAFIRKAYPEDGSSRSMLMQLENDLKKKIQEHEDSIKVQFEELQTRHSAEKKKIVDEWRTKEMPCIARFNAEIEVPSDSHNTEKRNPNYVVRDIGTEKLTTSGISVTVTDNAVDTLRTPANHVPNELLRIERAGAEPAIVVEQPGTQASQASDCNKLSVATVNHMHMERTNSLPPAPAGSVQMVEGSNPAVSQNESTMGMSSVEDMGASNLCSHQVNEMFASPTSAPSQVVEESMDLSIQETTGQPPSNEIIEPTHFDTQFDLEIGTVDSAARSETSLHTPANHVTNELLRVETTGQPPSNEIVEPTHCDTQFDLAIGTVDSAARSETSLGTPANHVTDELLRVERAGAELAVVVEQPVTQASVCNRLSVATVNHMHIERTNSLPPASAASVQMVEGSNPSVSQNENTMGMSSVEDMGVSNLCSHQVNERFASPTSVPSQVVEESMDLSHQETMGQPPSREIVEATHCDTQSDLEVGTGANDGNSVELPAASQNIIAPIPQVEILTRPPNQFVAQSDLHVHPMHHIGVRNPTLTLHPQSLLSELDTIQKMREQSVKLHDGKESNINSEYERKQEELRMEQQEKLKEAKSAHMREIAQIERNYKVASMHKTLSEALQFKCSDCRTMQQGLAAAVPPHFMQQMHQASPQPRLRHPSAATLSSTSHPTAGQHNSFSPVQSHHRSSTFFSASRPTMSLQNPSIQSHPRSSGPFASARPPQISSITPSVGSPRVGGEIRAPAPHLQPYRPPASSAPRLPTQLMTAPSLRPNLPSQSPSILHLSSLNQDDGSSQISEIARTGLSLSFAAMDQLMDNVNKAPLRNFAGSASSANASSDQSASRVPRDVNEGITAASDVVLLSDDES